MVNNQLDPLFIGIDTGSVTLSVTALNSHGDHLFSHYIFHRGKPREHLAELFSDLDHTGDIYIAFNENSPFTIEGALVSDERVSLVHGSRNSGYDVSSLLVIGGEKFGLFSFDEEGNYKNYKGNTSCAAGTGSFLDQQAERLNLDSIMEFSDIAHNNRGQVPKIASRCSVFAKTDIIHAQQEGYTIDEICDGLSLGLARNVVDTLFSHGTGIEPVLFVGGVALNQSVVKHIEDLTGRDIIVPDKPEHFISRGLALQLLELPRHNPKTAETIVHLLNKKSESKEYSYPPLELKLSTYPDFSSFETYSFSSKIRKSTPVEIDIYINPVEGSYNLTLGIDIGSTSTKAVLLTEKKEVLGGFYTRTSGRPVEAVQTLLESIEDAGRKYSFKPIIQSISTTGSGRKLVGAIVGSDLVLDEITAHAKAAVNLDPEVDTIIEIGGQDAKFTTLKNGMVTFSIMNNVCAAGTGSFIEEQAKKLQTPLSEYAQRTLGVEAPLSSDRCTVFMERDLNHYFSKGYDVDEILTSVLHSIRDNYLSKVAIEKNIGSKIFFQGATAKNKALIASFEQKLKKPIMVSPFCHLTGALGAALMVQEEFSGTTSFSGLDLYKEDIPIETEVCELCGNHCKIKVADIHGRKAAYGFLCGRDYETDQFVRQGLPHNLLTLRKKMTPAVSHASETKIIGIPSGLHMKDDIHMWEGFFHRLGISTKTALSTKKALKAGKKHSVAEFCAPMTTFMGQVKELEEVSDFLFVPTMLMPRERPEERKVLRHFCYYTQFAPSLVHGILDDKKKLLSPLLYYYEKPKRSVDLLTGMLEKAGYTIPRGRVKKAYEESLEDHRKYKELLKEKGKELLKDQNLSVVLLGRPYTLLSEEMNNSIPDIFSRHNVMNIYQDMIDENGYDFSGIEPLINTQPWHFGADILRKAFIAAQTPGMYPVMVTSFKCSPDSFIIDYFKEIMDRMDKPFLILQLDEHDSSVGYETRIEAAIRSFKNHRANEAFEKREIPQFHHSTRILSHRSGGTAALLGKVVLVPSWDNIACRLIVANLRGAGIDARLLEESPQSIQRSLAHNNGQCIPLNIIAQNAIEYIEKYQLDHKKTVVWNIDARLACNIRMFPYYSEYIFKNYGNGMEDVSIYLGELTFYDISIEAALNAYYGYMIGGMLTKAASRIRPYETEKGMTDMVINRSLDMLEAMFENRTQRKPVLEEISQMLQSIPIEKTNKPKVAIFGDLYARDNDVMNGNLVRYIEENGGEVITTPYSDYLKMIADPYLDQLKHEGYTGDALLLRVLYPIAKHVEKGIYKYFEPVLKEPLMPEVKNRREMLRSYNVKYYMNGESFDNLLKILTLIERYPDISFFVQTNPAFCCPSLITEAMSSEIERKTGKPIVTVTYDGTGGNKNDVIIPYLAFPRKGVTSHQADSAGLNIVRDENEPDHNIHRKENQG